MSQIASGPPLLPPAAGGEDPFRYGWRYVPVPRPDGSADFTQIPLTLEDVLHPQEGDVIPENTQQEKDRRHFHDVYERRLADDETMLSLSDCLVDWGHPTIPALCPDLTLLEDVRTKDKNWGTYRLAVDGGRVILVAEIVSPHTRGNDVVEKFHKYWQLGVPRYVVVDQRVVGGPRELIVYRHGPQGYVRQAPNAQGRYGLPGGVEVALEQDRLVFYDAVTGEELGDYVRVCARLEEEIAARQDEAKARDAAEDRADKAEEQARQAEEQARQAEGQRQAAAAAQQQAEEQARQAEEQRRHAEEQRQREAVARQRAEEQIRLAEERARNEVEARLRAEEARRELEEQVRRLEKLLQGPKE